VTIKVELRYVAVLLGTTLAAALYVFSRVQSINPIILGDEYIYSFNAMNFSLFESSPLGDYSTPLFEAVFSSVGLCGSTFYACAKGLNLFFLAAFIFLVLFALRNFIPIWVAGLVAPALMLSPLSAYSSMFLPESMMFAGIGLIFFLMLEALERPGYRYWALLGISMAAAISVKPHSMMFTVGVFVYLAVARARSFSSMRERVTKILVTVLTLILGRLGLGILLAGPSGIDFFGRYVNTSTVDKVFGAEATGPSSTGQSPMQTAIEQFPDQLVSLVIATFAFTGLALLLIVGTVTWLPGLRVAEGRLSAATFSVAISFFVYLIGVSLFAGWVSGTGDDHSARVLMRYLDVMIPMISIVGIAFGFGIRANSSKKVPSFLRWPLAVVAIAVSNFAFTDFFSSKEVQIADAPYLAGLITSSDAIMLGGIALALSVAAWAAFPGTAGYGVTALVLASSVLGGSAAVNQYELARGQDSRIERAGEFLANFEHPSPFDNSGLRVIATSRFDATGALFWAQFTSRVPYSLFPPQTTLPDDSNLEGYVLTIGAITPPESYSLLDSGQGYKLWHRTEG
jgi:hypothetical protein